MRSPGRARPGAHRLTPPPPPGDPHQRASHGNGLLIAASCLLMLLATAQGYVSFRAQYVFVNHAKHASLPSLLEALGLDTGAVIFALLALSLARRGRRAATERALNVACALGSLTMNLLAANLGSPRSVTVWVLPSALYALASDRLIAVVRLQVLTRTQQPTQPDSSPWRPIGMTLLWTLRILFDPRGTLTGIRRWALHATPIPASLPPGTLAITSSGKPSNPIRNATTPPGTHPQVSLEPGETKRQAMIRLYEQLGHAKDPRYGDRAKTAATAAEIAALIGYHPGTARRELARHLATPPAGHPPGTQPVPSQPQRPSHEAAHR
jgi:hypothetical protein